jgi:two-component system sensor histidine kinase BaeS
MRSLALKLTLAFLMVAVVGVVLTALFVRQRTKHEFDQFVLNRFQQDLYDELTEYYQANGGWEGINAIIAVGGSGPMGHRGVFPAPVTLLDADNTVVYGGRRYQRGQVLDQSDENQRVPIDVDGQTVGWLMFESFGEPVPQSPESPESAFMGRVNQAIVMGAVGAIVVALLIGILLARTISRPVRELTAATQMIAHGELGHQVPVRRKDELGELAASFNQMSVDLERSTELRRQMTADIAHELRTPLSLILGYTEALSDGKLRGTPETFDIVHDEAQHLNRLVDDLRTLSLADAGELSLNRRPVCPQMLLQRVATAYAAQAKAKDVSLRVEAEGDVADVDVDPDRMAQVLGNLVSNAMRHTPAGGGIALSAEELRDTVALTVSDSGVGIAPEHLPHVFDRFYRGDESRYQENGESGLGLAIAKSIVEAHGGRISVTSTVGVGTTVTVQISPSTA